MKPLRIDRLHAKMCQVPLGWRSADELVYFGFPRTAGDLDNLPWIGSVAFVSIETKSSIVLCGGMVRVAFSIGNCNSVCNTKI
jgi:hypothetical protein